MSLLCAESLEKLKKQLMRHEGAKRDSRGSHRTYRCSAGALTIGYGHNLDANPLSGMGATALISEKEARDILAQDIAKQEKRLREALPFVRRLDPARYAVLVNMSFNLGLGGLLRFRNTLADVENGNYPGAARRMLRSRWAAQVGGRARELARQMETGAWI